MNSIREIALTFCAAAVFTAALGMLNGRALQKSGRYIIALILLCSVIGAVANQGFSFDFAVETSTAKQNTAQISLCEYQAEILIGEILQKGGIGFQNITANATKSGDGSIIINEIEIETDDPQNKALEVLTEQGIDCKVVFR